jgi:hypothetical protein
VPVPAEPLYAAAAVGPLVFYVFCAVMAILLFLWAVPPLAARLRRREGAVSAAAAPLAEGAREGPLADALALAGEGRYAEAVHALLLHAIRRLAARSPQPPPPSRTSRELVRLLPLAPEARRAFAELVAAVERSLFGGAAVGREEFERSLDRYETAVERRA